MACFIAPMALGIMTLLAGRLFPKRLHVEWLNAILWGAVLMLMVEHMAHGEIVPYPPFLTSGWLEVIPEIVGVGVPMTIVSSSLWISILSVNRLMTKHTGLLRAGARNRAGPLFSG